MPGALPPGWPAELPPPEAEEFADKVTGWLLDRSPGQWRAHAVLRRHPRALAFLVVDQLQAQLEALRSSYGRARAELRDVVAVDDLGAVLAAIEAEGAVAAESVRQATQVAEAMSGVRWRARL